MLWTGQLVSFLGRQLTVVAVPFEVFELTHSTLQVGLVSLAQLVPLIARSLLGGAIVEAHDRRVLMIWTQVLLALTGAGLAVNAMPGPPSRSPPRVVTAVGAAYPGLDRP